MTGKSILFKNGKLFDCNYNFVTHDLLVKNSYIEKISSSIDHNLAMTVIDLKGKTLMPGLIDAHVHLAVPGNTFEQMNQFPQTYIGAFAAKYAFQMLMNGFTTVRDAGGLDAGIPDAINSNLLIGPNILFSCQMLSKTGGIGDIRHKHDSLDPCPCKIMSHFTLLTDGVDASRKAAREILRTGAYQIKIATTGAAGTERTTLESVQFSPGEIKAIVEEAEDNETYVMAHAHGKNGIKRAVESGVRSIEHCSFLNDDLAIMMHDKNCYMTPTLPPALIVKPSNMSEAIFNKRKALEASASYAIKIAHKHNVKVAFGSDVYGDQHIEGTQSEQFMLREKVDGAHEALMSATNVNAELLNLKDKIGILKENASADLIVVNGDPVTNIKLIAEPTDTHIPLVMKKGTIYKNKL